MQSLAPSNEGESKKTASNGASILCHASPAPAFKSKQAESHGDKMKALETKKPSSLPLKQNVNVSQKTVISKKPLPKPEIPASIEACDVSSLLDKFLEYELNQNANVNMPKGSSVALTPVSSPSHKSRCNLTEAFTTIKKPSVSSSIGLTPPVSPPSHQSIPLAAKSTPTPVIIYNKSKETPTSTKVPSIIHVNRNPLEKVTSDLKVPSDVTVKNTTDRELTTRTTSQNEPKKTPEKTRNDSCLGNKNAENPTTLGEHKSQENKPSSLPFPQERKERPAKSSITDRRKKDHYQNLKRSYSSEDDDDDDKDYYDYKRKKYATRDECYWSTSEEESDDERNYSRRRRGNEKVYSRRRHRSRSSSFGSDDNHRTYSSSKRSMKSDEKQRRKEKEIKSKNENCGDESDNERSKSYRRRQGNEEASSRKRHRSRSSSCGSDDNHSTCSRSKRSTKSHKQQRRKETESKKENCIDKAPVYDIETERKKIFKLDRSFKETATEKRKIVYIGNIKESMSKDDVWRRFREYGPIEKVTVHYRNDGDNYAFVTFIDSSSALEAIEKGNKDPELKHLDICFGGRRKFCGGSYVDFDSNTSYLEEKQMNGAASSSEPKNDEMDFDTLLKMCQRKSR